MTKLPLLSNLTLVTAGFRPIILLIVNAYVQGSKLELLSNVATRACRIRLYYHQLSTVYTEAARSRYLYKEMQSLACCYQFANSKLQPTPKDCSLGKERKRVATKPDSCHIGCVLNTDSRQQYELDICARTAIIDDSLGSNLGACTLIVDSWLQHKFRSSSLNDRSRADVLRLNSQACAIALADVSRLNSRACTTLRTIKSNSDRRAYQVALADNLKLDPPVCTIALAYSSYLASCIWWLLPIARLLLQITTPTRLLSDLILIQIPCSSLPARRELDLQAFTLTTTDRRESKVACPSTFSSFHFSPFRHNDISMLLAFNW